VEGVILDAGELRPGDRVVYPNQGVCKITGVEVKEIAGQKLELVRMEREEDGAAVLVPKGKVPTIGLRKVASPDQIEGVFHYLAAQYDDPELDWKIRHRDNADRLIAGGVLGVAEVVKGLHALSRIRPLPAKEREQYDNARHLLVHEISVSLAVAPALAEDYIDYALMPPAGVTFKLKPPPKPVELPQRPRRKVQRTDDDDLGLGELGLDIDMPDAPGTTGEGLEPGAAEEGGAPAIPTPDDIPLPDVADGDASEAEPVDAQASDGGQEGEEGDDVPVRPAGKKAPPPGKKAAPAPAPAAKKKAVAPAKPKEKEKAKPAPKPAAAAKKAKPAPAKKPAAKKPAPKGKKK
jgi:RNA polymerase-interacting CarD/CdnL/TRCF family regulator